MTRNFQGRILSEDGRVEFTELCSVFLDEKISDGHSNWFGWIDLPPGKAAILTHENYLLRLEDGTERIVNLRDGYAQPALFEGIGSPPWNS